MSLSDLQVHVYCSLIHRQTLTVSKPLCGWSGNPAGFFTLNSSSIRNGSKFLSCVFPMLLLTLAPMPSSCSLLSTIFSITRDISTIFWVSWSICPCEELSLQLSALQYPWFNPHNAFFNSRFRITNKNALFSARIVIYVIQQYSVFCVIQQYSDLTELSGTLQYQ